MANFWDEDDDDNEGQGDGPAALRKAYDKLKKDAQKLAAEKAEVEKERDSLKGTVRSRSVADLLQAKGVSPKVARFIPSDVEADEAAVSEWLKDNADVFNIKTAETPAPQDVDTQDLDEDVDPAPEPLAEQMAALQRAMQVGQQGGSAIPAGALTSLVSAVEGGAKSFEDVLELLNKAGVETTTGYGGN